MTILEDRALPHQIVLRSGPDPRQFYGGLAVIMSCTCLRSGRRHEPIAARNILPAAEARAIWEAWHEERGVEV